MVIKLFSDRKNSFQAKRNLMGMPNKLGLHHHFILRQFETFKLKFRQSYFIYNIGNYIFFLIKEKRWGNKLMFNIYICTHKKIMVRYSKAGKQEAA